MSEQSSNPQPKNHELPKAYDPSVIEDHWARYWVEERLFDVSTPESTQDDATKFTILLPPPNVTGRLHMGHMLNQTEMDILTRWHRMRGDLALWLPGTDHAGIATQMMVERQLKEEGTTRQQLGREAFTERVWCWRKLYGGAILDQMKRLGASVDWQREYFTMDDRLSVAVKSTSRASSIAEPTSSTGTPASRPPSQTSKSSTKNASARSTTSAIRWQTAPCLMEQPPSR